MTLELRDISAGYDGGRILHQVSLKVEAGTVVALLGANGAGKTTTLRVASGLLRPTSGRITYDGRDLTGARVMAFARSGICHVPEGRAIFPRLTVAENLMVFGRGVPRSAWLDRSIEMFPRLGDLRHRVAGTLSGGEQQMVALSRAYIMQTKVALLDEVSMGLAPIIVQEIFNAIPRLLERGMSLLIVEQYVAKALDIADYVYLLGKGRVVFEGSPAMLRSGGDMAARYLGTQSAAGVART
jgi:branched-chain amino acid transport system ATP-binding protein